MMLDRLKPPRSNRSLISLFTGAGGLDVGLEAAGFSVSLCVEIDKDAQETLKKDLKGPPSG